jgi:hypothetical protein
VAGRAEEIAKLTVLQTEYPALADDLHIEPRLPWLLLAPDSDEATSERARPLLVRHSLQPSPSTSEAQDAAVFIDEDAEPKSKPVHARHEQMRTGNALSYGATLSELSISPVRSAICCTSRPPARRSTFGIPN